MRSAAVQMKDGKNVYSGHIANQLAVSTAAERPSERRYTMQDCSNADLVST